MFQRFEKFVYRLPTFPVNLLMKILGTEEELLKWFVDERIGETIYSFLGICRI